MYMHFTYIIVHTVVFISDSVAPAPIITSLQQLSPTVVRVKWSKPSGGASVTGYVVHYFDGTTNRSKNVIASTTSSNITNLTKGPTYTISVEATSKHLSGESANMSITLSKACAQLLCMLHFNS